MWKITAQGSLGHGAARRVVELAESLGFEVDVEQVNVDFRSVDLTEHLLDVANGIRIRRESIPGVIAASGFLTLEDLAQATLEQFLAADLPALDRPLLRLMVLHGATFLDANPAEFEGHEIGEGEIPYTGGFVSRSGIWSWAMFPYVSEEFLLDINRFGETRLRHVKIALADRGLSLKKK